MDQQIYTPQNAERHKQIKSEIESKEKSAQVDFLQRARALENIVEGKNLPAGIEKSESAHWIVWGLRIFFISFELFPMIVKAFMVENEYHAYLEGRLLIAKQRMICYTNAMLEESKNNPSPTKDVAELSDYIARFAEDPYQLTHPPSLFEHSMLMRFFRWMVRAVKNS